MEASAPWGLDVNGSSEPGDARPVRSSCCPLAASPEPVFQRAFVRLSKTFDGDGVSGHDLGVSLRDQDPERGAAALTLLDPDAAPV